jgi:geranylgeranyl pyrophosphate synthase
MKMEHQHCYFIRCAFSQGRRPINYDANAPTAFKVFNRATVEVCEGQQMDMDFEQLSEVSESAYLEMIRLKLLFC